MLRHYSNSVKAIGPLWTSTTFGFEANNGVLKRYVNGTNDVIQQIAYKYVTQKSFDLEESEEENEVTVRELKKVELSEVHNNLLNNAGIVSSNGKFTQGKSIKIRNVTFTSLKSVPMKTADFFLLMKDDTIGLSEYYIKSQAKVFVLLQIYKTVDVKYHWSEVSSTEQFRVYAVNEIKDKMLYMKINDKEIITSEPNRYEKT